MRSGASREAAAQDVGSKARKLAERSLEHWKPALMRAGMGEAEAESKAANAFSSSQQEYARCGPCGGKGYIQWHPHWDNGNDPCENCKRTGRVPLNPEAATDA